MPAPTKVQLVGGQFQDSEGNPLALGYLMMKLAQDANIPGVGNIAAGIEIKILLDSNGSVSTSPAQSVWGNDQMLPPNNYYRVTGFTAAGQPSWGPNNQQVVGSGGTFDVGTWIPNQVISWTPPLQSLSLRTNGTPNTSQTVENLIAGTNITLTSDGSGGTTFDVPTLVPGGAGYLGLIPIMRGVSVTGSNASALTTEGLGDSMATTGTASLTTVVSTATESRGASFNTGGSTNNLGGLGGEMRTFSMGTLKDWICRVRTNSSTTVRYWIGFWDDNNNFNANFIANTNIQRINLGVGAICAFRYSTDVDTTWKAYVQLNDLGGNFTVVDTGVALNTTSSHLFEIVPNGAGSVKFYIDNTLVATITTANVPALSVPMTNIFSVDSVGTSNTVTGTFYSVWYLLSK